MNRSQLEKQMDSMSSVNASKSASGVSQFIRTAERHMANGKYVMALEQLSFAQALEPQNQYIQAIIERVRSLQQASGTTVAPAPAPVTAGNRYLSVTVGKEFVSGIKDLQEDTLTSPQEVQSRVRELTDTAQILLNRGLNESAFDALMKAYLLDPLSPEVLSCEKRVIPAWELARKQGTSVPVREQSAGVSSPVSDPPSGRHRESPSQRMSASPATDVQRIEALKEQKEAERRERERALWREASSLPKTMEKTVQLSPELPSVPEETEEKKERGLFSLLRRKRSLE